MNHTVNEFEFLCLTILRHYKDLISLAFTGFPFFGSLDAFLVAVIAIEHTPISVRMLLDGKFQNDSVIRGKTTLASHLKQCPKERWQCHGYYLVSCSLTAPSLIYAHLLHRISKH